MTGPCVHPRRFFFRQRIRFVNKRPACRVVERCLDCRADVRAGAAVPNDELQAAGLLVAALDLDPWENEHG